MQELNCVETVLAALNAGTGAEWSENSVMAHGLCARQNRLGNALDHLMCHQTRENAMLCVFLLATEIVRNRLATEKESVDLANDAIAYWLTRLCPSCKGAGRDFNQVDCPHCQGTGLKHKPKVRGMSAAIAIIEATLEAMELQLRRKLKGGT